MTWSRPLSRMVGVVNHRCDLDATVQDLVDLNIERRERTFKVVIRIAA